MSLQQGGKIKENPLVGMVASVSVGVFEGHSILDLDYDEDSTAETDMNIVMNSDGGFVEIQGTAEAAPFTDQQLNEMLDLAKSGINHLFKLQNEALLEQ
jgi:ribonuclease PH